MADPVTIIGTAGAAANVLSALTSTIEAFRKICVQWKNAEFIILNLIGQLTALKAAVKRIQEWIVTDTETHHELNEDLNLSLYCCQTLIEKLHSKASGLCSDHGGMDGAGKIKLVFGSNSIDSVQQMISQQTGALTLFLTTFNCAPTSQQKIMQYRTSTQEMIKRVQDDTWSLYEYRDAASFRSYYTDKLSKLSITFTFDKVLLRSDVYQRLFRGSLKDSLRQRQFDIQRRKQNSNIEKLLRSSRQQSLQEIKILLAGDCETRQSLLANMLDGRGPVSIKESFEWRGRVKRLALARLDTVMNYIASAEAPPENVDLGHVQTLYEEITACDELGSDICTSSAISGLLDLVQWQTLKEQFQSATGETIVPFDPLESLPNALDPTYHPTHQDVLQARPQNQIDERRLKIGPCDYLLIDPVGNKYWNDIAYLQRRLLPFFELTSALVFVIDLSSYDRPSSISAAGQSTTGFDHAFRNYNTLVNCSWMRNKGIILLFTGWDAFAWKLVTSPLKHYFPDFEGGDDGHEAYRYICTRFTRLDEKQEHRVYDHICGGDGGKMLDYIVGKAQEIAMKQSLRSNSRSLPR